jgi:hypothetical protein
LPTFDGTLVEFFVFFLDMVFPAGEGTQGTRAISASKDQASGNCSLGNRDQWELATQLEGNQIEHSKFTIFENSCFRSGSPQLRVVCRKPETRQLELPTAVPSVIFPLQVGKL